LVNLGRKEVFHLNKKRQMEKTVHYTVSPQEFQSLIIDAVNYAIASNKERQHPRISGKEKLTRKELCERYKISYGTLHKLMRDGAFAFVKFNRKTLFDADQVEAYFEANKKIFK